ncbi:response regulator [Paucibacter sp. R3-3]|uniref:Response regulator n=1 Tax=Roseateles agri TaxID=3098619 RepID=A0ABU5DTA3_9BURK|nr:response regulator [Paucibacter sp. R3-3]MDY0748649.1 response regulator [Paucibacter sp. R3-3]
MRIFLVEGSVANRRLLVRKLRAMPGVRVVGEANGETQALALIDWTRPDLILMSLPLAEGSGLHLLAELRRRGHSCRIAVMTSQERPVCWEDCLAAGADAFYDKATDMDALFAELAQAPRLSAGGDSSTLLREGLRGLYNNVPLCERLAQSTRSALRDGMSLAVYVLRLSAPRSIPAVQADLVTHLLIERMREASDEAGTEVLVRRSATQFSLVMPQLDDAAPAAERASRLGAMMGEPVSAGERGSALKVELGMALFATDPLPVRGMLSLNQATSFAAS